MKGRNYGLNTKAKLGKSPCAAGHAQQPKGCSFFV